MVLGELGQRDAPGMGAAGTPNDEVPLAKIAERRREQGRASGNDGRHRQSVARPAG